MKNATEPPLRCVRHPHELAVSVWSACSVTECRPVCEACDLELNTYMLTFLRVRGATKRLAQYRETMRREPIYARDLGAARVFLKVS